MAEENKPKSLDELSKAKLKVTLRNMLDVAELNPAVAEQMKGVIELTKTSLKKNTIEVGVGEVVEECELLNIKPEEFADAFEAALIARLKTREEERAKKAAEAKKSEAPAAEAK